MFQLLVAQGPVGQKIVDGWGYPPDKYPSRDTFNTLKKETNLFLDSMTLSSAFATLISMKQGEKTQKIAAKYICDRLREGERRVKYNLV